MARRSRDEDEDRYEDEEPRSRRRSRDDDEEPRSRRRSRDEDEEPRSRRRSRDEDEDRDEDAPRSSRRSRSRDEDEDDEEPRSRRRRSRDEDDEEPRSRRRRSRDDDDYDDDDDVASRSSRKRGEGSSKTKFRRGWSAAQQVMDSTSDFAQNLKLEENVQLIKFLEDSPYASYSRHWVELGSGKDRQNRAYTCLQSLDKECPLCEEGDRPQAVSAFNVALIGDDGEVSLRTWDVGSRLLSVIKSYNSDKKIGPITRGYYAVSRRGQGRNNTTYTVLPVKENYLEEDYDVDPPSEKMLSGLGLYDETIVDVPSFSELRKLAQSLSEGADYR